jgi:hypothetical protein
MKDVKIDVEDGEAVIGTNAGIIQGKSGKNSGGRTLNTQH